MENKDSFGHVAAAYRDYRPGYPAELYAWLASCCERRDAALDCATGSGQAAVGLAEHFERVVACDFSPEQIAHAMAHPRVEYRVCAAEALPFEDDRFALITAAQGAHWFDLPAFYASARRVAHRAAVIAIWGYRFCSISPRIDEIVRQSLLAVIEPYWGEGNLVIRDNYRTIEFPFAEIDAPSLTMRHRWNRDRFFGYLHTWSATRRFIAEVGHDPTLELAEQLDKVWPRAEERTLSFELPMRVGRIE